jgi:signal transduction histidine kinase
VRQHVERVLQGEVVIAEYPIRHKSGEQRWLRIQRQPVWDSAGTRVIRFYGVAQDITEQRRNRAARAEQERLTTILDRERRWNTHIGQMVRVLSHELRVPLAVINSSSDLIQRYEHLYGPEQRAEKSRSSKPKSAASPKSSKTRSGWCAA